MTVERAGPARDPGLHTQPPSAAPAHSAPPSRAIPGTGASHRHVLVAIVVNRPGVLNRVASLMRARSFNIESLAVSHTDQPDISRMTLTLNGDDVAVEQAAKQLYRLIDVLKVQDVTSEPTIEHELALVKVRATDRNRAEVLKVAELYGARVVDLTADSVIVEASGSESAVDELVALLRGFGIKELVRTGTVVMSRGSGSIQEATATLRSSARARLSRHAEVETLGPAAGGTSPRPSEGDSQ
jgi:acetolactate synthase I/III small subunit